MAVTDAIVTALERNWDMVDRALAGMDYETMARRPNDAGSVTFCWGNSVS